MVCHERARASGAQRAEHTMVFRVYTPVQRVRRGNIALKVIYGCS